MGCVLGIYERWMPAHDALRKRVAAARRATLRLIEPLSPEDMGAQSMPDASPTKWHLAHTTWFFERFVLRDLGVAPVSPDHDYLFNSYYDAVGRRHPRAARGLLTRPALAEGLAPRRAIDARLADLSDADVAKVADALVLGANHEEQHQELILTDVLHLFAQNALLPAYRVAAKARSYEARPLAWRSFEAGLREIGAAPLGRDAFSFDNERPRHRVHVAAFDVASRLTTCGEYRAFVEDGGYRRPELWLSEGFAWVNASQVERPHGWLADGRVFSLEGARPMQADEPVRHLTYYEADAFARWSGARLPTEAEWEVAASGATGALDQLYDECWQWTSSAYAAYPGFVPLGGAFGEYNGKFMVSQMVLRGGSLATPRGDTAHTRATYRNFFPPSAAWQFTGVRLARNA